MKTDSDIDSIKELLLWARDNDFALHRLQVGSVVLDVSDIKPIAREEVKDAMDDVYAEMGRRYGIEGVADA